MECVQNVMKKDFQKIKSEAGREQKTLSSIGGMGIYSDGSLDNSSFDLVEDLERIHEIIFSRDIPYEGRPNMSAGAARDFFSSPQAALE